MGRNYLYILLSGIIVILMIIFTADHGQSYIGPNIILLPKPLVNIRKVML